MAQRNNEERHSEIGPRVKGTGDLARFRAGRQSLGSFECGRCARVCVPGQNQRHREFRRCARPKHLLWQIASSIRPIHSSESREIQAHLFVTVRFIRSIDPVGDDQIRAPQLGMGFARVR
jgi:hypothetical protein